MKDFILSVVTPERSIVNDVAVESIVLPGEAGQLTLLPGHINFITTLTHGTFAYKIGEMWQIAYLSGGFTQVFDGKVTVLAETLEMSQELEAAQVELELKEINDKLKTLKVGTAEYNSAATEKTLAMAKLKAAQNKIH